MAARGYPPITTSDPLGAGEPTLLNFWIFGPKEASSARGGAGWGYPKSMLAVARASIKILFGPIFHVHREIRKTHFFDGFVGPPSTPLVPKSSFWDFDVIPPPSPASGAPLSLFQTPSGLGNLRFSIF